MTVAVVLAGCASQTPSTPAPLAELPAIGSSVVLPDVAAGTLVITTHCDGTPGLNGEVRVTRDVTLGVPCAGDWESTSWVVFGKDRKNVRVSLHGGQEVDAMRATLTWQPTVPTPEGVDLVVRVPPD